MSRSSTVANWPTDARKRAHKRPNRRRKVTELAKEQLQREKTNGVRV
jgi:hypothetical protein